MKKRKKAKDGEGRTIRGMNKQEGEKKRPYKLNSKKAKIKRSL